MRIIVENNYDEMSRTAAGIVADEVRRKPDCVLGLATGSTPLGMYRELIAMYQREELDFSGIKTFNLDEYFTLPPDHPQSYHYFMFENFFNHINVPKEQIHLPQGTATDIQKACQEYEKAIAQAGGIDLLVLGIGENGHIGFNEPAERLQVGTHLADLTEETVRVNSRFFPSLPKVPRQAVTMGLGTILKARRILLLANGLRKAPAIKETVSGFITTKCPASLLQVHPDMTLILDREAASLLKNQI
ncbi:MAG: glucosamine-6-phosphate deaminase [Firmicutes bacterium]|nr:glucosamine-6-phosphate deaminase [Bacillota bacterium]